MQKITSKEELEKKRKRNQIIVGAILVVILVLSTAGYALLSGEKSSNAKSTKINYNDIEFIQANENYWYFTIQDKSFLTAFNPQETENISGKVSSISSYLNKPVYFEENSDIQGVSEISRNLGQLFSRVQYACLTNCSSNNPIKNCSDNVISIKQGETLINSKNNCVYITAPSGEIIRASDAFIFKVLGIQK